MNGDVGIRFRRGHLQGEKGHELSDEVRDERAEDGPDQLSEGAGDNTAHVEYVRARRSPVNLILAGVLVLLVVAIGVAVFFVVEATQTQQQPRTMGDAQIQALQQQIQKNPRDGGLYLLLAAGYFRAKAYDKALKTLSDLQSTNPTGTILAESIYAQARIAQVRGDNNAAISGYQKSLKVSETADARWALGTLYLSLKQYKGATENLERYLALMPRDADGYAKLGAAYEGLGNRPKALEAYTQANTFVPDNPVILAAIKRLKGQH